MGHWNYRVIKRVGKSTVYYDIQEVYYNNAGDIEYWTDGTCAPWGETRAELNRDLALMTEAFSKPTLRFEDGPDGVRLVEAKD